MINAQDLPLTSPRHRVQADAVIALDEIGGGIPKIKSSGPPRPSKQSALACLERVAVTGAGPAGLRAALGLAELGVQVDIFEQRLNPHERASQDDRSFNLTLCTLGREAAGSIVEPMIVAHSQRINGRCIYTDRGAFDQPYGLSNNDYFLSISRSDLTRIQTTEAARLGAKFFFEHEVVRTNPHSGIVEWRRRGSAALESAQYDLVILADGVGGAGRQTLCRQPFCSHSKSVDSVQYVKAHIESQQVARVALRVDRIAFWVSADSGPAIGIPNADGSMNLLLLGKFGGNPNDPPFTNQDQVRAHFRSKPLLLETVPDLPKQLTGAPRGSFCTAIASHWVAGPRAVGVGDAGRCVPPYAGAGGAAAMDDARHLIRFLAEVEHLEPALARYEEHRRVASRIFVGMVGPHGQLLNSRLGSRVWRIENALKQQAERWFGFRDLYQRVVFDPHGLERMVAREQEHADLVARGLYPISRSY